MRLMTSRTLVQIQFPPNTLQKKTVLSDTPVYLDFYCGPSIQSSICNSKAIIVIMNPYDQGTTILDYEHLTRRAPNIIKFIDNGLQYQWKVHIIEKNYVLENPVLDTKAFLDALLLMAQNNLLLFYQLTKSFNVPFFSI